MNIHEYKADKIIRWAAGRPISIGAAYRQLRSPCAARMLVARLATHKASRLPRSRPIPVPSPDHAPA